MTMTNQTESETDLNCEHLVRARDCPLCFAALLRDLDSAAAGIQRLDRLDAESAAKAIRLLEAKAEAWKRDALRYAQNSEFHHGQCVIARADRARIAAELRGTQTRLSEMAGEVERLTKLAYDWKRKAEYLGKDRERLVLMNESLGDSLDAALKAGAEMGEELAKARENEARYLLYCSWVTGPGPSNEVHLMLRNARTPSEVDAAFDAARRAGEGEK